MIRTASRFRWPAGRVELLAFGGVAGPLLFVALVVAGGVLYDGYSHTSQTISELGGEGSEYAWLQNLNFIVLGVLLLGFSWALASASGAWIAGPALIAFFALSSAIGNGLLPCDLGCEGQTTVGLLHNITGLAGFVAAVAGMLVLSRRWRHDPRWQSHARLTRAAAFVALAGLVGFIATEALEAEAIDGLLQRVFVAALLGWITITGLRLSRESSRERALARASAPVSPAVAVRR